MPKADHAQAMEFLKDSVQQMVRSELSKLGIPRLMSYGVIDSVTVAGTSGGLSTANLYLNGSTTLSTNIPVNPDIAPILAKGDPVWVLNVNFDNRDMYVMSRHNGLPLYANPSDPTKISFDNLYGNTLTLGGSGNGNGLLTLLNSSGQEIIRMDSTGITESNGGTLIGGSGVLSELLFVSSGQNQGWQNCGWFDYSTNVNTMALLFVYIPSNFTITKATLYSKHLPYYENDTIQKWWYLTNGQLMFGADATNAFYNGVTDSYVEVNNMTDITSSTWGSYWNPSGTTVQIQTCDVTSHLTPGQRVAFGVNSHDSASTTGGQLSGMMQFELVVTGYKSS